MPVGGYDMRGFIVLRGCVSTSTWLMALAEKSCHLNRKWVCERDREREQTHTHVCVIVRCWKKEKSLIQMLRSHHIETSHPEIFISLANTSLSLSHSLSLSFFYPFSFSFLLRKVIRGLMESPNRSSSHFSSSKKLFFLSLSKMSSFKLSS